MAIGDLLGSVRSLKALFVICKS